MRTATDSSKKVHRRRRGAVAVEFAIILPLLVTIVLGCVDFGRFAYSYIALTNAARAGAAVGSMNVYSTSTLGRWTTMVVDAAAEEMSGQTGFDKTKLQVTVTSIADGDALRLKRVQVVARYPFKTIVNWPWLPTGDGADMMMKRTVVLRSIRD